TPRRVSTGPCRHGVLCRHPSRASSVMHDREHLVALVRAAQAGDERAFAALVGAFQDVAVAYATSLIRDYHSAEDATQEAFVDAYRALPSLREPAAFPSWFRRVVYKHCDRITRRKE